MFDTHILQVAGALDMNTRWCRDACGTARKGMYFQGKRRYQSLMSLGEMGWKEKGCMSAARGQGGSGRYHVTNRKEVIAVLVKRDSHHAVGREECLLDTVTVMNVNVEV